MKDMGTRGRRIVTLCIFITTFMAAIEATIVSTAMPTISGQLQGGELMSWVFSIYFLTTAMTTPIYGKLADRIGRKPIFLAGIMIFIVGSALCGLSQNMVQLIIFRAIQGAGAGAMIPVSLTILGDLYEVEKRTKMLGLDNAFWGIASVVGPLCGGFLVSYFSWHWIFFVNVPIGIVLLILLIIFQKEVPIERRKSPIDYAGSLALMAFLLALLYGFQLVGSGTVPIWQIASVFLVAILLFGLFLYLEKRAQDPVIPLSLFKNREFVIVHIVVTLIGGFLIGVEVYVPLWMQGVLGLEAGIGGLVLTPLSIMWMVGTFIAGMLMARFSAQLALSIGVAITLLGASVLMVVPAGLSIFWFCILTAVLGIGFGITISLSTIRAQAIVPHELMGVATSFNMLSRTIGQTVMVAIFGVILNRSLTQQLALHPQKGVTRKMIDQLSDQESNQHLSGAIFTQLKEMLMSAIHTIYFWGFLIVLVAFLLSLLQNSHKKTA